MQIDLARADFIRILLKLVRRTWLLKLAGVFRDVTQLAELANQLIDALETVQNAGAVQLGVVELDTAPEEAYPCPCQSYIKSEPQEWVRQNCADRYEVEE